MIRGPCVPGGYTAFDTTHRPVNLGCAGKHTLCLACLRELIRNARDTGFDQMPCPYCRQRLPLDPFQFRIDHGHPGPSLCSLGAPAFPAQFE